jgi:3-oxoacyl-[acyl-carrier protein] reductase
MNKQKIPLKLAKEKNGERVTLNKLELDFKNKTVFVTGVGHGIGRQICKEFAIRNANVIGVDILQGALEETKAEVDYEISETGSTGKISVFTCDLTKSNQIDNLIGSIIQEHEKIDILVNVAGGVVGQVHQPIEKVTDEQWDQVVKANLNASFYTIRAIAPYMKNKGYGRIVNISSGAGRSSSLTGIQAYTSSKAGQIGLTRQMARELGPFGITVNNIAPGFIMSNPSTLKQWDAMGEKAQKDLVESISLKRLGKPEDIAHPVLFFASDFSAYISGQVISADGGKQLF